MEYINKDTVRIAFAIIGASLSCIAACMKPFCDNDRIDRDVHKEVDEKVKVKKNQKPNKKN